MPVRFAPGSSLILSCAAALALAACGGGDDGGGRTPSGAVCPTPGGTTLRYVGGGNGTTEPANFGKTFFDSYCIACHGPPINQQGQNFTTYAGILPRIAAIDTRAASGPNATNGSMPPSPPQPTLAERQLLGTWIACGAPEN